MEGARSVIRTAVVLGIQCHIQEPESAEMWPTTCSWLMRLSQGQAPRAGSSPAAIRLQTRATGKASYFCTMIQPQERMKYGITPLISLIQLKTDTARAGA